MREEVVKEGDRVPSQSTVRRLFEAPTKANSASRYYSDVISAKPATKRNDVVNRGTANAHRHGCFSLMKMVKEWAELNCEEVFVFSVDDKAKVFLIFQNLYFCVLILFSPRSSSGSLFSID